MLKTQGPCWDTFLLLWCCLGYALFGGYIKKVYLNKTKYCFFIYIYEWLYRKALHGQQIPFWLCHPWTLAWWKPTTRLMCVFGQLCSHACTLLRTRVYFSKRQMYQAEYSRRCQTITWDLSANWVSKWVILSPVTSSVSPLRRRCQRSAWFLSAHSRFWLLLVFHTSCIAKRKRCLFLLPFLPLLSRRCSRRLLLHRRSRRFEVRDTFRPWYLLCPLQ